MHQKTQNHFSKFSIHLSVRKSRENCRQIYGKSKASLWRNLSTGTPPKFFSAILCFVALVHNYIFFRTAVLRKLFDIRFSYKHCNFLHVCLNVKMASKTVPRSIVRCSLMLIFRAWVTCDSTVYKTRPCLLRARST